MWRDGSPLLFAPAERGEVELETKVEEKTQATVNHQADGYSNGDGECLVFNS
jgi:hypothetical protein